MVGKKAMSDDPDARNPVGDDARMTALDERIDPPASAKSSATSRRRAWRPMRIIAWEAAFWPS
jgi:hypothetical protein